MSDASDVTLVVTCLLQRWHPTPSSHPPCFSSPFLPHTPQLALLRGINKRDLTGAARSIGYKMVRRANNTNVFTQSHNSKIKPRL